MLAPLLSLLLLGGAAAVPSAESQYREAKAVFDRGNPSAAGAIASAALARFGDSDDEWVWRLRILQADVLIADGRYDDGRKLLRRRLPAKLAGSDIEILRLRGLAVASFRLDERDTANPLIREALALAKKRPDTLLSVLLVLATYDEKSRESWLREALKLARQNGDVPTELRVRGTMGVGLANEERFDEAIAVWEPGLSRARSLGNLSLEQKFEGNLGWAYLELGDYDTAGEQFTHALATAMKIGQRHDAVPWMYQLGNVLLQRDDLAGAEKQYRAAYDLAVQTKHVQKPIILVHLANAALKAGRVRDAQQYAQQSLDERHDDEDGTLRSRLLLGRVAMAAGRNAEAERILKDVLAKAKSQQTLWEAHGRLAQLYTTLNRFREADTEFQHLLDTARETRASIKDQQLRFAFFTALTELFDSYVDYLVQRGRASEALVVTDTIRAQTLDETAAAPRDVRAIARATRATILCYWLGNAHSYLWIVTPQSVDVVTLPPRRSIESAVDAYQRDLLGARGSLAMSGARGIALWRMLIEPAARGIAVGSRVIVVPDGRLHAFNLETLVAPSPKPHYWIEDAVISTAGSLRLLARGGERGKLAPRLLLVGNTPPPPGTGFPALPRASVEMEKVASHFDRRSCLILSGAKATPAAYRSSSPASFTFLHFVAHGVATRLKPLDSAIVLARDGDAFKLYARDIAKEPLTARLVTISSCHGAGTRAYVGEGLVGLGWAFLRAGANNVIAALWEVSDRATPDLMDRMYAGIRAGRDPAVALREAKLALVRGQDPYRKPFYWAPFVLYSGS